MTKQDIAGKLAQSVRRAMQPPPAEADAGEPSPPPSPAPSSAPTARFARQTDQSPPASLDRPWHNLHPERVWPD